MKPILYESTEREFTSNGIGVLNDCIECTCEEERNGIFECSLVYPISGQFYHDLKLDRIILVKASSLPTRRLQPFRIYKISKPITGKATVYARHISYDLNYILVDGFEAASATEAMQLMKTKALDYDPQHPENFRFNFSTTVPNPQEEGEGYSYDFYDSIRSRLGGAEGSVLDIWHGEFEWDVWDVKLHESRGQNRGVIFRYGGNITDMTQEGDIGELITRILPYLKYTVTVGSSTEIDDSMPDPYIDDGTEEELSDGTQDYSYEEYESTQEEILIKLDGLYVDAGTIANYSYPRAVVIDFTNEIDNDFANACLEQGTEGIRVLKNVLRSIAEEYMALQGVVNEHNQISFIPPEDIVELCDTVTVVNEMLGVTTTTKIKKVTYNVLLEEYTSIEIGDLKTDFTESISSQVQSNNTEMLERYRSLEIDILKANGVVTQQLNAQTAKIGHLTADTAIINRELVAQRANIHQLNADVADIGHLNAAVANIGEALIGKATVAEIEAATGYIYNLNADYARIKSLLAGNQVTGDLQAIHLTSQTAVIDQAVIDALVANYGIVHTLLATYLDTSAITIRNSTSDGGIEISGDTIKFIELDENDQPFTRIQIGRDSQDNFTFILYDSTGEGVLIDQTGIKSSSIADGLIRDEKLAVKDQEYSGITADKLNIDSVSTNVVNDINSSSKTIKSANIYFDDQNKTLNQIYSEITNGMTDMAAAISGIDTLASINMTLSNDFHIVHTYSDGTGADYTNCKTNAYVYMGTVDITNDSRIDSWSVTLSDNVYATWSFSGTTKQVSVTNMTGEEGYIDIKARYREDLNSDPVQLVKRFKIVKIADGQVNTDYILKVYPTVIYRKSSGVFNRISLQMSKNENGTIVNNVRFAYKMYYTSDGNTYTLTGQSSGTAISHARTPASSLPTTVRQFRIEAYDANNKLMDMVYLDVINDTGEISNAVQTLSSNYASTVTGPDGLVSRVGGMETQITGVTNSLNKILLYNITHVLNNNNTTTLTAHVWKEGAEVTSGFETSQFTWFKKTEAGEVSLGSGYSVTVNNNDFEYTGTVVGRFTVEED